MSGWLNHTVLVLLQVQGMVLQSFEQAALVRLDRWDESASPAGLSQTLITDLDGSLLEAPGQVS